MADALALSYITGGPVVNPFAVTFSMEPVGPYAGATTVGVGQKVYM